VFPLCDVTNKVEVSYVKVPVIVSVPPAKVAEAPDNVQVIVIDGLSCWSPGAAFPDALQSDGSATGTRALAATCSRCATARILA